MYAERINDRSTFQYVSFNFLHVAWLGIRPVDFISEPIILVLNIPIKNREMSIDRTNLVSTLNDVSLSVMFHRSFFS